MGFNNGVPNANSAARLPWLVKGGIVAPTDRYMIDDSKPNNWLEFEDNAAGTGKIHYLIGVDTNNQTYLRNPNGVLAFDLQLVQLATPAAPTITNVGTAGAVTWTYVVVARNGVFVVEAKAPGMRIAPMSGMDLTRKLYAVHFDNTPAEKIGETGGLSKAFDIATTALVAEMVGGMQRTLDITVEYAKMRKQFSKNS